jgi:hypothetical protein
MPRRSTIVLTICGLALLAAIILMGQLSQG